MKILHICSSYFKTSLYKSLFAEQEKLGLVDYVYVPLWSNNEERKDSKVFVVDKKFSRISKLLYWGEQEHILEDIEKRIDLSEIGLIHVHRILYGGYAALHIKEKYGIPFIVAIRNSDFYGFGRNICLYKKHCWEIIHNASRVVFVSEPYKTAAVNIYSALSQKEEIIQKSIVVPNGIDDYFQINRAKYDSHSLPQNTKVIVLFIGDIDGNKNVTVSLKSLEILISKGYDVAFKVAGKIRNNKIFEKIKSKRYVSYLGILNKEQVRKEMLSSDVFIMPSIHETFGLVYAEAMTQGLPVLYTRGQGFDGQYKDGEVGYAVDCHNAHEIANRILDILSNYRSISNNCIKYSHRYSWPRIAKEYYDIYSVC